MCIRDSLQYEWVGEVVRENGVEIAKHVHYYRYKRTISPACNYVI